VKTIIKLVTGALLGGLVATNAAAQSGIPAAFKTPTASGINKVQFKLPFGMSSKRVRETLRRDGYDEIEITKLGVLSAIAEACRQGKRYRLKVRVDGRYDGRNEIGRCRKTIASSDIEALLSKEGFRRLDIQNDGRLPYSATGCRQGERYNLSISEYGDVKVGQRIGRCRVARDRLSPRDLRQALRKDGYNRIKFTDRSDRRFVVEACNDRNRRIRLTINRRGRIRDRERIGRCPARIKPDDVAVMLTRDGFNRVEVVDSKPPRYRAEACNPSNVRVRVLISPWGEMVNQRKIGQCSPPTSVANLTEQLRTNDKFKGVSVRAGKRHPFVATLCDSGKRREVYFSRWGEQQGGKDLGPCRSKRLSTIIEDLRDDGVRRAQIFIEGCRRNGRRVRYSYDAYGNRTGRERIGRCSR